MSECPYCGAPAEDVYAEIVHMRTAHPEIIRERLERAGIMEEEVPLPAGAVALADVCEFLRSATREDPATGRDRHMSGWRAAADELERHFGGTT